jgi:hypothetical protein
MTAPRRRWFAFSLRTPFVLVTVLACWIGYQLHWIRQRHKLLDEGLVAPTFFAFSRGDRGYETVAAPSCLGSFGEQGIHRLAIAIPEYDGSVPFVKCKSWKRACALFPEAQPEWFPASDAGPFHTDNMTADETEASAATEDDQP